jgi:hypothetical protein
MAIDATTVRTAATGTWGVLRDSVVGWLRLGGLVRLVLWVAAINGILYFTVVTKNMPFGGLGYETLINMLAVFPPLAAVIAAEGLVLGEHRSGVAAWTISKPVPRTGYVAAKLVALWMGMAAWAVIVPGLVGYWWLPKVTPYRFVRPEAPPFGDFLGALLALALVVGFFIMVTGFLATLLRRRGAVALIVLIAYLFLRAPQRNLWSDWDRFTPAGLISTDLNGWSSLTSLVYGEPFTAVNAVVWTAVASVVLLAGSMLVYRRLEL